MKTYTMILLALLGSIVTNAQSFTWIDGEETGYNLNPSAVNYSVCVAPDQTVWFGGLKEKVTNYYSMMGNNFLIRYDSQGNRMSDYLINGSLVINIMKCDPSGHLYIAGDFINEDVHFWDGTVLAWNGNSINSFLARINDQGTVDWAINLNVVKGDYSPVSDMVYRNGKLYMAHSVWLNSFISEIDNQGNLSVIVTETDAGLISGLDFDSEGNLYTTGSCSGTGGLFNGVNFPSPFFYNKRLVKYDPNGVPLWVRFVEDVTCIQPKVKVDHDNNIYWTGILESACSFDTIQMQGPSWVYDLFLVKMNPQGNALWAREVPQVMTGDASIGPMDIIRVMPDNSVTIAGYIRGMIDWGNGVVTNGGGSLDIQALLLNFNEEGIAQWGKTGGGYYYADSKTIDTDPDGNLFMTGVSHDTSYFDNLSLYKDTYYYPYIVKLESSSPNGIHNQMSHHFTVYPDPAKESVTLSPGDLKTDHVEIIDLTGRTVLQFRESKNMNISSLDPGVYFVKVHLTDGTILGEKMVKQ